jgi:hypothetical protein
LYNFKNLEIAKSSEDNEQNIEVVYYDIRIMIFMNKKTFKRNSGLSKIRINKLQ